MDEAVVWSDETAYPGKCIFWAKHPCKPPSMLVCGHVGAHDMSNLHICEGAINAESNIWLWNYVCRLTRLHELAFFRQ